MEIVVIDDVDDYLNLNNSALYIVLDYVYHPV